MPRWTVEAHWEVKQKLGYTTTVSNRWEFDHEPTQAELDDLAERDPESQVGSPASGVYCGYVPGSMRITEYTEKD
jgi:hypothetical protein